MITKVYYSLRNNGDGSAGLSWFESQELANIDQEFQDEGFAESCTGWITIKHDTPIEIQDDVATVDTVLAEIEEEIEEGFSQDCVSRKRPERKKAAVLKLKKQKEKTA